MAFWQSGDCRLVNSLGLECREASSLILHTNRKCAVSATPQMPASLLFGICVRYANAYQIKGVLGVCLHTDLKTPLIIQRSCAQIQKKTAIGRLPSGELAGARTQDPNIKSVVLYLLSYEFIAPNRFWWCKDRTFFSNVKIKSTFF